eukprot:scaffold5540_cov96-Cylindrotheca_fusiformis.AAC.10
MLKASDPINHMCNLNTEDIGPSRSRFEATKERSSKTLPQCPGRKESLEVNSVTSPTPIITDVDFINKQSTFFSRAEAADVEPSIPQRVDSANTTGCEGQSTSNKQMTLFPRENMVDMNPSMPHRISSMDTREDDELSTSSTIATNISDITDFDIHTMADSDAEDDDEDDYEEDDDEDDDDDAPQRLSRRPDATSMRQEHASKIYVERMLSSTDEFNSDLPPICPKPSKSLTPVPPAPLLALQKLAGVFMSGCKIGTHSYLLKRYENTFVGSEAVDFMLRENLASTREDAVFLGQRFYKEMNLFHHVCWDHTFKDGYYFYRFTDKNENEEDLASLQSDTPEHLSMIANTFSKEMEVATHFVLYSSYKETFLGREAIDHMIRTGMASTRLHACFLGNRILKELGTFYSIQDDNEFKDGPYLYRFQRRRAGSSSSDDDSRSVTSLMSTLSNLYKKQCSSANLSIHSSSKTLSISKPILRDPANNSSSKSIKRVSFGMIHERYFERCLTINPATTSGPSVGLGWNYHDVTPAPMDTVSPQYDQKNRLSRDVRFHLLKEWGFSKVEISKAVKANEKIRKQRNRTLNKLTTAIT